MEGVKPAPATTVNSITDLAALLKRQAEEVHRTHEQWACHPRARWIAELMSELKPEQVAQLRKKERRLQVSAADDFPTRWELSAQFASAVIESWFADRSVEEVLAKSDKLGHTTLKGGVVLSGALVREWAAKEDIRLEGILPIIQALTAEEQAVPLYRVVSDNHFQTEGETNTSMNNLAAELRERLDSGRGGVGSLNTTWEFTDGASESGVGLLDDWMAKLDELAYTGDTDAFRLNGQNAFRLNHRLYLIWKLQGYCTPYHQDVHVPPHFTLYNQVSGVSTFHFLPLLIGLYATFVGRRGTDKLAALLAFLRCRGIGEIATLTPKQMLLILPSGAHGVFVPRVPPPHAGAACAPASSGSGAPQENDGLPPFDFSVIRAAELYAQPTDAFYSSRLMGDGDAWCRLIEQTDAERSEEELRLQAFTARQEALCNELQLTRDDWLYFAMRLQQQWEAVAQPALPPPSSPPKPASAPAPQDPTEAG